MIWHFGQLTQRTRALSIVPLSKQADQIIEELKTDGSQQYLLSTGRIGDKPINGFSKAKRKSR